MKASKDGPVRADAGLSLTGHLFAFLGGLALFVLSRPYAGIEQDAHFYAVQALRANGASALDADLFFRFGNQEAFSVFTRAYAPVVDRLGLPLGAATFWAAGGVLWLTALVVLCRAIFAGPQIAYLAVAAALVLSPYYGNAVLRYGEPFVTPRLFAESFAMLSIASALGRHWLWAGACVLAASVVHPLTGLPALVLALRLLAPNARIFGAMIGAGALLAVALAFAGVAPFVWLGSSLDPEWERLSRLRDSIVFPSGWEPARLVATLVLPGTALFLVWSDDGPQARLARAVGQVCVLLMVVAVIGADLLGNRLMVSLQLWRVLIFAGLIGNVLAVAVFVRRDTAATSRSLFAFALCLSVLEYALLLVGIGSALVAVSALLARGFERARGARGLSAWQRILSVFPGAIGTLLVAPILLSKFGWDARTMRLLLMLVCLGAVWLGLVRRSTLAAVLAVPCVVAGLIMVDARSAEMRKAEGSLEVPDRLIRAIDGRSVYWEGGLRMQWLSLQRPAYFSCRQKGGSIFFRAQAVEFERRAEGLRGLATKDFLQRAFPFCPQADAHMVPGPTEAAQVVAACRALPDLDLMLLKAELPGLWSDRFAFDDSDLFLYDCASLR